MMTFELIEKNEERKILNTRKCGGGVLETTIVMHCSSLLTYQKFRK